MNEALLSGTKQVKGSTKKISCGAFGFSWCCRGLVSQGSLSPGLYSLPSSLEPQK